MGSPLTHVTAQIRLRFMAWLILVGPIRKEQRLDGQGSDFYIPFLIFYWAKLLKLHDEAEETCDICTVSHLLPIWIETMLQVYSLDDLRSIHWHVECDCLDSFLTAIALSGQCRAPERPPGKNSAVFWVLYELVVPLWPLLLWVAFRTMVNDRTDVLQTFLDSLNTSSLDQDLFTWDDQDESALLLAVKNTALHGSYPQDWNQYMVEIDLETWSQIRQMTNRPNDIPSARQDLMGRIAALFIRWPSSPIAFFQNVVAPLDISFDHSLFAFMARTVDENYKERSTPADFESEEFWTTQNLEDWLLARSEVLCRAAWQVSSSTLERVQIMDLVLNTLPQNLTMYAFSLVLQRPESDRALLDEFLELGYNWEADFNSTPQFQLESLTSYYLNIEILLGLVEQSVVEDPSINHTIATDVYEHMNRDIYVVVARLVLLLRDPPSYKLFLASQGTEAQCLLDLLQDLLDLDSFSVVKPLISKALLRLSRESGLHPRCCTLTGLQKIGQQVTGGGFGDIWRGLVRGQGVSVKIMRIFEDSDVQAVLKEFGREALIWRQLCHPNVLPFFGLYYLGERLCLVSPWMENGHVMKFLTNKNPTNTDRLSLILDIALALQYLHEKDVVHGDLKGLNILVTPSGRACIADFGVSSIVNVMTMEFTHSTANARAGTARYQAPELFRGESQNHFGSDVYAFACVCYEIMTEKIPFYDLPNDMTVMFKVLEGKRPLRPMSWSGTRALDNVWSLMENCWGEKAEMRPSASQIVEHLIGPSIGAKTTSSTTDWDEEFTSKFRRSLQAKPLLPSVTQIERMLFGDEAAEACVECVPDNTSSDPKNEQGLSQLARAPKRPYEGEISYSNTQGNESAQRPAAKKSKPSLEIRSA
ncbi:kinase-like domain-containing protein [Mycena epipterygia]|nr:kinase-like domain-containing protein [Mycena epipterygia]